MSERASGPFNEVFVCGFDKGHQPVLRTLTQMTPAEVMEAFRVNDGVADTLLVGEDTPERQRKAAVAHDRNLRLLTLVTDAMPEWTDNSPLTLPEALHRFWPFAR